uniref:Actin-associated protein FAM107A n=1 Tax=Molossus molossus TaxID=27622 RepID=A0A7J8DAV8_MOLMO|nr:hypothetical protein HJG59_004774 [Molossus molossus]
MYSEIQRERADIGGLMARPEYREWNPELIKPKKLLNPVKASRSHQELHRELLMNHRRGLGVDSKPELQRVLEHRRRNQLIKKKKEELEAKRLQCPFEQELLRRQQRLNQLEKPPEKDEDRAPEFIKVRENLRRIAPPFLQPFVSAALGPGFGTSVMFMLAPVKMRCSRGPAYPLPPAKLGSLSSQDFPSERSPLLLQEENSGKTSTGHLSLQERLSPAEAFPAEQGRDRGLPA